MRHRSSLRLLSSSSSASSFSGVMKLSMRLLFTSSTGASPQAPKHSPSFSVKQPSRGGLAEADAELRLQVRGGVVGARQRARQVGADRELVAAGRLRGCTWCRSSRPRTPRSAACRGSRATSSIASVDSQPCSSCAIASAAITADCFWSAGILGDLAVDPGETTRRQQQRWSSVRALIGRSPRTRCPGADDRHDVGDHVAARHLVHRRRCGKPGARIFRRYGLFAPSEMR